MKDINPKDLDLENKDLSKISILDEILNVNDEEFRGIIKKAIKDPIIFNKISEIKEDKDLIKSYKEIIIENLKNNQEFNVFGKYINSFEKIKSQQNILKEFYKSYEDILEDKRNLDIIVRHEDLEHENQRQDLEKTLTELKNNINDAQAELIQDLAVDSLNLTSNIASHLISPIKAVATELVLFKINNYLLDRQEKRIDEEVKDILVEKQIEIKDLSYKNLDSLEDLQNKVSLFQKKIDEIDLKLEKIPNETKEHLENEHDAAGPENSTYVFFANTKRKYLRLVRSLYVKKRIQYEFQIYKNKIANEKFSPLKEDQQKIKMTFFLYEQAIGNAVDFSEISADGLALKDKFARIDSENRLSSIAGAVIEIGYQFTKDLIKSLFKCIEIIVQNNLDKNLSKKIEVENKEIAEKIFQSKSEVSKLLGKYSFTKKFANNVNIFTTKHEKLALENLDKVHAMAKNSKIEGDFNDFMNNLVKDYKSSKKDPNQLNLIVEKVQNMANKLGSDELKSVNIAAITNYFNQIIENEKFKSINGIIDNRTQNSLALVENLDILKSEYNQAEKEISNKYENLINYLKNERIDKDEIYSLVNEISIAKTNKDKKLVKNISNSVYSIPETAAQVVKSGISKIIGSNNIANKNYREL